MVMSLKPSFRFHSAAIIDVNFAVDQILPQSRRKQQTVVGFLSLVGGFLGLLSCFSVISGFELLFYFIFEPIFKRFKRNDLKIYPMNVGRKKMTVLRNYCNGFFKNSSVHGFKYIGDGKKSIIER
jgi:hypothetical protein